MIFDLGYSYTQIKDPKKGLSFESSGNLNMQMGLNNYSAEDVINKLDEKEFKPSCIFNLPTESNDKPLFGSLIWV